MLATETLFVLIFSQVSTFCLILVLSLRKEHARRPSKPGRQDGNDDTQSPFQSNPNGDAELDALKNGYLSFYCPVSCPWLLVPVHGVRPEEIETLTWTSRSTAFVFIIISPQ